MSRIRRACGLVVLAPRAIDDIVEPDREADGIGFGQRSFVSGTEPQQLGDVAGVVIVTAAFAIGRDEAGEFACARRVRDARARRQLKPLAFQGCLDRLDWPLPEALVLPLARAQPGCGGVSAS